MVWFLVWVALVAGALLVIGLLVRRLWRAVKALGAELATTTAQLEEITARLESLPDLPR
ncbi:MAG TPA: hypothetical protein VLC50_00765 [Actinomycetes bacterium]|nr:hypothetical protein [Actinomycetes bacterium]